MKKVSLTFGAVLALSIPLLAEDMKTEKAVPQAEAVAPMTLQVIEAGLGTGVVDRALQGQATSFDTNTLDVYCFTKVEAENAPTSLTHVWSVDGKEVADVPLNIGGSPWRTWSRKKIYPGQWKVEVKDAAGGVATTLEFSVTKAAPASQTY